MTSSRPRIPVSARSEAAFIDSSAFCRRAVFLLSGRAVLRRPTARVLPALPGRAGPNAWSLYRQRLERLGMRRFSSLGFAVYAFAALLAAAPAAPQSLEQRYGPQLAAFEALARKEMEATHTTGLAVALQIGDQVWARAY